MRTTLSLVAVTSVFLALAACGDDGDTGSGGGTTTASTGGAGTGATGGGGGEPLKRAAGENCAADDECQGGVCISEDYIGWAGGYCSQLCDNDLAPCGEGELCLQFSNTSSACFKSCDMGGDCTGTAQTCEDVYGDGTAVVCLGGCTMDSQCKVACNNDVLLCASANEVCDNGADDDFDLGDSGFVDCEDADCAADTTCQATISGACTAAEDVSAGGTFTGNTSTGTNAFSTVCSSLFGSYLGGAGGNEKIFKYVAPEAGNLTLDVTTTTGSVDWYLRTDCADGLTSLGFCGDETVGPAGLPVNAGDTFFIYVDGYMGDAAYSLDVSFEPLAPVCNAATTITLGATNGNTTPGSAALSSTCGGGGKEVAYTYTPAASGMLSLTLASASDQGIHVRTDCLDSTSEIGCADSKLGGTNETLSVPVTNGMPVTITVDAYSPGEEGPFTLTLAQP